MTKLSDTHTILLSHAAQHDAGSFLPLPGTLAREEARERVSKTLAQLVDRTFAVERETSDATAVHRTDGDLRYGLFITAAGLAAIGVEDEAGDATPIVSAPMVSVSRVTKSAAVLALLQRHEGATLTELIEATGWLPHTTRAALTGLRKKGHAVERVKRGDTTCYRVAA